MRESWDSVRELSQEWKSRVAEGMVSCKYFGSRSKLTGWLWESGTLKMRGRGKKDAVLRLHVPCT